MLKGKTAIITGTKRGIGQALLEKFAERGADVWACVRKEDTSFQSRCMNISERYQVNIRPVCFDMSDDVAMKDAIKAIKMEKRPIDILVNNAGVVPENRLFQMASPEEMQRVFVVNFFSVMKLTQMVSKAMVRQRCGSIVNIASIAALDGGPGQIEYVASKAALVGATKKLAAELGSFGIRVNAVAPGVVNTGVVENMEPKLRERMANASVLKRLARPMEIAEVVAFIASDLSSYVTGQIIRVDGGLQRQ